MSLVMEPPKQWCPKCEEEFDIGLFCHFRNADTQLTENCLLCRFVNLARNDAVEKRNRRRVKKDDFKSVFRAQMEQWLNNRVDANKLTGLQKENVLSYIDGLSRSDLTLPRKKAIDYSGEPNATSNAEEENPDDQIQGEPTGVQPTGGDRAANVDGDVNNAHNSGQQETMGNTGNTAQPGQYQILHHPKETCLTPKPATPAPTNAATGQQTAQQPAPDPTGGLLLPLFFSVPPIPRDDLSRANLLGECNAQITAITAVANAYQAGQQELETLLLGNFGLEPVAHRILNGARFLPPSHSQGPWLGNLGQDGAGAGASGAADGGNGQQRPGEDQQGGAEG
ncbi:MAG: hypothetical protein M1831_002389 [Alyxoria varia]|nr:MAG: hypothetical protein M1831_002389 [Alyxoria varia]